MKQTLSLLIILIFALTSCSKKQVLQSDSSNGKVDIVSFSLLKDTLIKKINGKTVQTYILSKDMKNELKDFPRIMNKYNDFEYNSTDSVEIIGDGEKNLFKTRIGKRKDGLFVKHTIMQRDNIIWNDSLLIDDSFSYYWTDSLFYKLKPYSEFYIAYKHFRSFVEGPLDKTSDRFTTGKIMVLNKFNSKSDSIYWNDYLANYKGRLITNLSVEDNDWLIWDKRQKAFIHFYEP